MTSQERSTSKSDDSMSESFSAAREFASMAIVVGVLATLGYAFIRDQLAMHHAETPLIVDVRTTTAEKEALCGPNTRDGRPTPISMMYSDDKQRWIEDAAQIFSKLCPNIQVKLNAVEDVASADAILSGSEKPTLWAPADDLIVQYLAARWKKERPNDQPLFKPEEQTSIAASPLVLLIWRDRAQVTQRIFAARKATRGPWVDVNCAQVPIDADLEGVLLSDMVPGTWIDWYNPLLVPPPPPETAAQKAKRAREKEKKEEVVVAEDPRAFYSAQFPSVEKIRSWGHVKVVHTPPTRSAAGLESIYLMAYDYLLPYERRPDEVRKYQQTMRSDPAQRGRVLRLDMLQKDFSDQLQQQQERFLKWLRRCEAGLDPAPRSVRLLTDSFFHVGSSRYDAIVTYEHLAFDLFRQIDEFGRSIAAMELVYPSPTLMNQHPVVILDAGNLSVEEIRAANKWIAYLRSTDVQKKAVDMGFRPVASNVSIREHDSVDNPFLKYRRYGIDFESPVIEPPRLDSSSIAALVRIWQDATGRN
ncbi:MAG TPA: substrate-binding domain-containing protein [Polyangium sp.]|nr:substrate-binding domain-containing protein [Polyangium sp.]